MKRLIILLVVCVVVVTIFAQGCFAALDYAHGYFQQIKGSENFRLTGNSVQLADGKLFIFTREQNFIFDPKSSTFSLAPNFKDNVCLGHENIASNIPPINPVLLDNNQVIFFVPYTRVPLDMFSSEIENALRFDMVKKRFPNQLYSTYLFKEYLLDEFEALIRQPYEEKEKMALELFKNDKEFLKKFNDYKREYELSMYAQIYDPVKNEFRNSGRMHLRRSQGDALKLNDGRILILGSDKYLEKTKDFEIYDPKTEEFTLIKPSIEFESLSGKFVLNDGRVFVVVDQTNPYLYDPDTNIFKPSKVQFYHTNANHIKLEDDTIIFTIKSNQPTYGQKYIMKYNPYTEELTEIGTLKLPREDIVKFGVKDLKDGNLFIFGGVYWDPKAILSSYSPQNVPELFNLNSRVLTTLKRSKFDYYNYADILQDGRILLRGVEGSELYIPKGYKSRKENLNVY